MKPAHVRIADFWCKLMHTEPMWPSHGQYECRTCGRRHRVCWEDPMPAVQHRMALPDAKRERGALEPTTETEVQCLYQ